MIFKKLMPCLAVAVSKISPSLCFSLQYFHHRFRWPDLKNPKDFSEVIGSQIVNHELDQYAELVDKIAVRKHLQDWGLGEYLPQVYAVWESSNDILITNLPDRFILKTNHGSGGHIICKNKDVLDIQEIRRHFSRILTTKYNVSLESQYEGIKPLVYAEEFIDDGRAVPTDYKFMCMDGEIKAILLCFDRDSSVHKLIYSEDWEKLPYVRGESYIDMDYPKPENFELMKDIVRNIAQRFVQVRIDLYNAYGKIFIGELTFSADGGILRNFTTDAIKAMGRK